MSKKRQPIGKNCGDELKETDMPEAESWKDKAVHDSEASFKLWQEQMVQAVMNLTKVPADIAVDQDLSEEQKMRLLMEFSGIIVGLSSLNKQFLKLAQAIVEGYEVEGEYVQ